MSFLLAHIFFPWFDEAIGKNVIPKATSLVRELPEKGAEVICHLEQNIEALIMENQSYYYKVSFIDETGIEREGYVAKRNLKIINQEKLLMNNQLYQEIILHLLIRIMNLYPNRTHRQLKNPRKP